MPQTFDGSSIRCSCSSTFFLFSSMAQYFKVLNLDRREYVCLRCMLGGGRLSEWFINGHDDIFTLLTCTADDAGHEDDEEPPDYLIASADRSVVIAEVRYKSLDSVETSKPSTTFSVVGRWAGDDIRVLRDGDTSDLWDLLPSFRNISRELVDAWNSRKPKEVTRLSFDGDCPCID